MPKVQRPPLSVSSVGPVLQAYDGRPFGIDAWSEPVGPSGPIRPEYRGRMFRERRTGHALPPTDRQLEVLRSYVKTGTDLGAARHLGISERTVEAHLNALRSRLRVHNDAQAVYALWLGYRDHIRRCGKEHHEGACPRSTEFGHDLDGVVSGRTRLRRKSDSLSIRCCLPATRPSHKEAGARR